MNISLIHQECGKIFTEELFDKLDGRSFACEIWDVMTCNEDNCDNCIGENFNQLIDSIDQEWFKGYSPHEYARIEFYVYTYVFWLYLFYERIEFIINEIDPEAKFALIQDFRRGLKSMNEIRLWANFIKHPKHFMFAHWPEFKFIGQSFNKSDKSVIVNTAFLKEHYSKETDKKPQSLENNDRVVVQFPKLDQLTLGFCKDLKAFFRFICDNKILADHLKKKSNRKITIGQ